MTKSMKEPDFTMGSDSESENGTPRNKLQQDQYAKTQNFKKPEIAGAIAENKAWQKKPTVEGEDKKIDLL